MSCGKAGAFHKLRGRQAMAWGSSVVYWVLWSLKPLLAVRKKSTLSLHSLMPTCISPLREGCWVILQENLALSALGALVLSRSHGTRCSAVEPSAYITTWHSWVPLRGWFGGEKLHLPNKPTILLTFTLKICWGWSLIHDTCNKSNLDKLGKTPDLGMSEF